MDTEKLFAARVPEEIDDYMKRVEENRASMLAKIKDIVQRDAVTP